MTRECERTNWCIALSSTSNRLEPGHVGIIEVQGWCWEVRHALQPKLNRKETMRLLFTQVLPKTNTFLWPGLCAREGFVMFIQVPWCANYYHITCNKEVFVCWRCLSVVCLSAGSHKDNLGNNWWLKYKWFESISSSWLMSQEVPL